MRLIRFERQGGPRAAVPPGPGNPPAAAPGAGGAGEIKMYEEECSLRPYGVTAPQLAASVPRPGNHNGQPPPPSSPLGVKLQHLAKRVINMVLEMNEDLDLSEMCCRELRTPGYNSQIHGLDGFVPLMEEQGNHQGHRLEERMSVANHRAATHQSRSFCVTPSPFHPGANRYCEHFVNYDELGHQMMQAAQNPGVPYY